MKQQKAWPGIIEAYRPFLPVEAGETIITLSEGATPLIAAHELAEAWQGKLYLKFEGANPTGSFKDRGMTLAVSKAVSAGARAVICASTGNTSAAAAAYAARAGIRAIVVIPSGNIALGKLAQAQAYGSTVLAVDGNFDDAFSIVRAVADRNPEITLVNSINPYRIPGQRTGAFEICDALGDAPDILAIPVGNAGNISAYWQGFEAYREAGRIDRCPSMWGFQAEGAAPMVEGDVVPKPETAATAIRIGDPANRELAQEAVDRSNGRFTAVPETDIQRGYKTVASMGILAEPASTVPIAGLLNLAEQHDIPSGAVVVCVLTGHGLKDPDFAINSAVPPVELAADFDTVNRKIDDLLQR